MYYPYHAYQVENGLRPCGAFCTWCSYIKKLCRLQIHLEQYFQYIAVGESEKVGHERQLLQRLKNYWN